MFFLSHATSHAANEAELHAYTKFFVDIENAVREKSGASRETKVAFWDHRDLKTGEPDFDAALKAALDEHPIGVVLLSPGYLSNERPYCRWEFEALQARNTWSNSLRQSATTILVVDWINAEESTLPPEFPQKLQRVREHIAGEDKQASEAVRMVCTRGLRETLKLVFAGDSENTINYEYFVSRLAAHIVAQGRLVAEDWIQGNRPKVAKFDASRTWGTPGASNAGAQPSKAKQPDSKKIVYAVVAAKPEDVSRFGPGREFRYEHDGYEDWRPFAKNMREYSERVTDLLQDFINQGYLEGEVKPHLFTEVLDQNLSVYEGKYPIIVLVDPWTLCKLEDLRAMTRRFKDTAHGARFITVWNDEDPDLESRLQFELAVAEAIGDKVKRASTRDTLRKVFCSMVEDLRIDIRAALKPNIQRSGSPKPTVSATS